MKNALLAQLAFTLVAAAGVYSFIKTASNGEARRLCTPACALRPHYANTDRLAPDFELPTIDGQTKKLSDYRGKVVVLNFWTKTCRPCLEEMPSLADFSRVLEREGDMVLLTVSTDESVEDAKDTLVSVLNGDAPFTNFVDTDRHTVSAGAALVLNRPFSVLSGALHVDAYFQASILPERLTRKASAADFTGDYRASGTMIGGGGGIGVDF